MEHPLYVCRSRNGDRGITQPFSPTADRRDDGCGVTERLVGPYSAAAGGAFSALVAACKELASETEADDGPYGEASGLVFRTAGGPTVFFFPATTQLPESGLTETQGTRRPRSTWETGRAANTSPR
jgi:hypothetical protein